MKISPKQYALLGICLLSFMGSFSLINNLLYTIPQNSQLAAASGADQIYGGTRGLSPASGALVIYVSSSQGNDANKGTTPSSPVKTLAKGQTLVRMNHSDWMVLKRGDVWNESFGTWTRSGASPSQMTVISSYGTGARPLINVKQGSGIASKSGSSATLSNFAMIGIQMRGFYYSCRGGTGAGCSSKGVQLTGNFENIIFDDMFIEGFTGSIDTDSCETCNRKNLTVTHSIIANNYTKNGHAGGMYITGTDGLFINNSVFYHNGWENGNIGYDPNAPSAEGAKYNQGLYLTHHNGLNTVVRNNIIAESSNNGVWLRRGGTIENNLFLRNTNSVVVAMGPSTIKNNVILETVHNYYSSDPGSYNGMETKPTAAGTIFEGNIIAHAIQNNSSYRTRAFSVIGDFDFGYDETTAFDITSNFSFVFKNNILFNAGTGINIDNASDKKDDVDAKKSLDSATFSGNKIVQTYPVYSAGTGICINTDADLNLKFDNNSFWCGSSSESNKKFSINGLKVKLADFQAKFGSSNIEKNITFKDPNRSLSTYLGTSNGYSDFIKGAIANVADSNSKYSAATFNDYIREGFGVGSIGADDGNYGGSGDTPGGGYEGGTGGGPGGYPGGGNTGGGIDPGTYGGPGTTTDYTGTDRNDVNHGEYTGPLSKCITDPSPANCADGLAAEQCKNAADVAACKKEFIDNNTSATTAAGTGLPPTPTITPSGAGGLIPCNGTDCDFADFITLIRNIINAMFIIAGPLAAISFSYAGWLYLTSQGNVTKTARAKSIFTTVLIGFIILLSAWLVVTTILSALLTPAVLDKLPIKLN